MEDRLLEELCSNLEKWLNLREDFPRSTVEFFSGLKPHDYFLPAIHIGTTKSILESRALAWFVEIRVDDVVIFRESYVPNPKEDLKIVEGMLRTRMLQNIFNYGVMSSKHQLDSIQFLPSKEKHEKHLPISNKKT